MNSKVYKCCSVPLCKNTTIKSPNKVFVHVPYKKVIRDKWLKLARRNPNDVVATSSVYFCEDHFDLPNDMLNYMEYHVMGSVSQVRMKPGCIPHKFACQSDSKTGTSDTINRPYKGKKRKILIQEESEKQYDEISVKQEPSSFEEIASGSSDRPNIAKKRRKKILVECEKQFDEISIKTEPLSYEEIASSRSDLSNESKEQRVEIIEECEIQFEESSIKVEKLSSEEIASNSSDRETPTSDKTNQPCIAEKQRKILEEQYREITVKIEPASPEEIISESSDRETTHTTQPTTDRPCVAEEQKTKISECDNPLDDTTTNTEKSSTEEIASSSSDAGEVLAGKKRRKKIIEECEKQFDETDEITVKIESSDTEETASCSPEALADLERKTNILEECEKQSYETDEITIKIEPSGTEEIASGSEVLADHERRTNILEECEKQSDEADEITIKIEPSGTEEIASGSEPASIQISKVISLKKNLIKDLFPEKKFGQCRCCLSSDEHKISNVGEMLECLNVQVLTNPHLPTLVCSDCEKFLQEAKRFRDMVAASQKTLLSAVPKDNITDAVHTTGVTMKIECEPDTSEVEEECESRTSEVKEEIIDADDGSSNMETQLAVLKKYLSSDVTVGVHIETQQDLMKDDTPVNNPEGDIDEESKETELDLIDEGNLSDLSDHFDTEFDDSVFKEILTPSKLYEMARSTDAEFNQQLRENITAVLQNSTAVPFTTKRDDFACLYCAYSSKTFNDVRTHTQTEHRTLDSDCVMHALKVHSVKVDPDLVIRVDISSLECVKCGLPFDDIQELVEHLKLFHDTILHDLVRDPPYNILCFDMSRDDFSCVRCDMKFSYFKRLLTHMNQHYGSFLCPVCGSKFLHELMYKKHVAQELEGDVRYQCSACDAHYSRKQKLWQHTKMKHPDIAKLWRLQRGRF